MVPLRSQLGEAMTHALAGHGEEGAGLLKLLSECQDPCPRTNQGQGAAELAALRGSLEALVARWRVGGQLDNHLII